MMRRIWAHLGFYSSCLLLPWGIESVTAQVLPDGTLPTQVLQAPNSQGFVVRGGAPSGVNLFHSFEAFSPGANSVLFDLQSDGFAAIEHIFSRVTGPEASYIDGLVQIAGGNSPDLFLLSPKGLTLGPNARLDLGGSFFGTTAESIQFGDGLSFSTTATDALLSLSLPVGLQLGQNAGAISLAGPGHEIVAVPASALPVPFEVAPADYAKGLRLAPGNTLALVSNGIFLDGGTIQSQLQQSQSQTFDIQQSPQLSGGVQFSLGSGRNGVVALHSHPIWGWALDYGELASSSDLVLANKTRIDGTGLQPSSIQLSGNDIDLVGSSTVYSQNLGVENNGDIRFQADGRLFLGGASNDLLVPSSIRNSVGFHGDGGDIDIRANDLSLTGGSNIVTNAFSGSGDAGTIKLKIEDSLSLTGMVDGLKPSPFLTLLTSATRTEGASGGVDIETGRLTIEDGSLISSLALFGTSDSGNIQISAKDSILIRGINPLSQFAAGIASSSFFEGNAGSIRIDTPRLSLLDRGFVEASIYASGDAGDITVNASELVEIGGGASATDPRSSYLASTAELTDSVFLRRTFGLPPVPSGRSGNVIVNTPVLNLFDGGRLNTTNEGVGDAGSLEITANRLSLDGASLQASTAEGNGGNIRLRGLETLTLRNESVISASAGGQGNGGNIEIDAQSIIAKPSDNSDITANAMANAGGTVLLDTSNLLGFEVRPQLTDQSDITASSELGAQFNGTVELNQPNTTPDSVLPVLPEETVEPVERLAQGCDVDRAAFYVTGRGGLPRSPLDLLELSPTVSEQWAYQATQTKAMENFSLGQPEQLLKGNLTDEATGLVEAIALRDQGFYPQALDNLQQLSQAKLLNPNPRLQVQTLRQLGITYRLLGQLDDAQGALQQSLDRAQAESLTQEEAATTLSLGHLAQANGEPERANQLYQGILAHTSDASLRELTLVSLMGVELNRNRWGMASQWQQQLNAQLDSQPKSSRGSATGLHAVAVQLKALKIQGDVAPPGVLEMLRSDLQMILTWAKQQGEQQIVADSLGYLGQVEEQSQNWQLAQQYSEIALERAQVQSNELMQYQWAWQLGRIAHQRWQQTGQVSWYEESKAAYRLALTALQSLRSDLVTMAPELQVSFRSAIEPVYREYVDLLLAQFQEGNAEAMQVVSHHAQLKEAIDTVEALRLAELDNYLQDACLTTTARSVAEIDPDAAVIYPIILDDRLEVIVSRPQGKMSRFSTTITRQQLNNTVKDFRDGLVLRSQRNFKEPSQQLYEWLIQPFLDELKADGTETLVFVPDGTLKNIPLAALSDGEQYLIEQFQVAMAPSLKLLPSQVKGREQGRSLVAGVTEENQGFLPLPFVSQELDDIQASIPGQVLLNEQFTRESLAKQIEQNEASIVHVATHGQFSSRASETFVLAWNERINLAQLGDILHRRSRKHLNPIELLVLSACETAVGDDASALGLAGMAVRSGARSTLASLWSVNDQSTAELMAEFYQQLAQPGVSKAAALRKTQLAMLQDPVYQHPYYWSAFVLVGDWQ